jgi:uncharacterized protein (TIGR01319 family)
VEGNLGLRVSARGILETVGEKGLLAKCGFAGEAWEQTLADYTILLEANPEHLAGTEEERCFDRVMAEAAVEVALKRHAGYIAQQFDPILGIAPGTPIGRDLRPVKAVIAIGGIFVHSDEQQAAAIVAGALKNPGISLLPTASCVVIDKDYLLYAIGILSQYQPTAALRFAKRHFNL